MHSSLKFRGLSNYSFVVFLAALGLAIHLLFPATAEATGSSGTFDPLSSLPGTPVTLSVDDRACPLAFLAYRDPQGRIFLSLSDAQTILAFQIELDAQHNLHLQNNGHTLLLSSGDYVKYDSWSTANGPGGKVVRLDMIYLPLAAIAGEWDFQLKESADAIALFTPEYNTKQNQVTDDLLPDGLPAWGSFASVPGMANIWPDEVIDGGYYTTITNSSANRINNIVMSCSSINGRVLAPGEVFSFNGTVGQRTTQRGYRTAPVYSGNKVVTGVGGGICQTSTTLYNASRDTGMQVIERHHHTLPVHYIASGNDATVSWGTADFKFRNNKDYAVRILARVYKNYVILAVARAN